MAQVDGRTGIEIIDRDEALELLARDQVGRLAVSEGGAPLIVPVNYALDGSDLIFRTAPGTKLDAVHHATRAAFEIDEFDAATRSGWSVVVRGRLEEITRTDTERWDRVRALPDPWAEGEREHVLALVPSSVTGRRLRPR